MTDLFQELRAIFPISKFSLDNNANLVFVCGKALNSDNSARQDFLNYAKKNLSHFFYIIAEDIDKILQNQPNDLLTMESKLADHADCIIIFLESESAFAELGAFSHSNKLAEKILVINNSLFKEKKSFITQGPLKKIDKASIFGETIYTNFETITSCSSIIEERLNRIVHKQAKAVFFNSIEDMKNNDRARILLLSDIILLLSPITKKELIQYLRTSLFNESFPFLDADLALLEALKLIRRRFLNGDKFFIGNSKQKQFLKLPFFKKQEIRSRVIIKYKKKDPKRLLLLATEANDEE